MIDSNGPPNIFNKSIYDFYLDDLLSIDGGICTAVRIFNALDAKGIKTLGELCSCSKERIHRIKNLGKKSHQTLEAAMDRLGLSYDMEIAKIHFKNVDQNN